MFYGQRQEGGKLKTQQTLTYRIFPTSKIFHHPCKGRPHSYRDGVPGKFQTENKIHFKYECCAKLVRLGKGGEGNEMYLVYNVITEYLKVKVRTQ